MALPPPPLSFVAGNPPDTGWKKPRRPPVTRKMAESRRVG